MNNKDILTVQNICNRLKIFWISLLMVFTVVSLQYVGIHAPKITDTF